jgi:HTH-type transcriptional regulator / antitoxin HigA
MAYKSSHSNTSSATAASGARLNPLKYAELLSGTLPRIIEDDAELERVARQLEPLLDKGDRRSREEDALCRLLLRLIEDYQQAQQTVPNLTPKDALAALMEARNLRQADLLPIFGSRSRISEAVNGKREISKAHARKLAEFFSVSPELFI